MSGATGPLAIVAGAVIVTVLLLYFLLSATRKKERLKVENKILSENAKTLDSYVKKLNEIDRKYDDLRRAIELRAQGKVQPANNNKAKQTTRNIRKTKKD